MPEPTTNGGAPTPLSAFVSFPSPYTQSLLLRALATTLPAVSIDVTPPDEADPPRLQWADYDLLAFDKPHADTSYLISSYVYRKALIRKHQLHAVVSEYLAKARHRGVASVLAPPENGGVGGIPAGWIVDLSYAEELDELLMDDLYDLREAMADNERGEGETQWFILKPGFADRAQGIRLFSTEDELREIFDEFEPPSDDEDEDEDEDEDDETALARRLAAADVDDDDDEGTGVMTSHLRHFVIQEYLPRPVLFDLNDGPSPVGQKFHLRAYVLVTGGYKVYLAHTMLALFSGAAYVPPTAGGDLRPHLTNTCLQTDGLGAAVPQDDLVRLFWDLEGADALASTDSDSGYETRGKVTRPWLEDTFAKAGAVVAEAVKAGAECGSFALQLMPNAFEIFGVDLLLSYPPNSGDNSAETLPTPDVTLLEFNASPDFLQSGEALRPRLLDMFKGVVHIAVAPFFGIEIDEDEPEPEMEVGDERWGWRMVGKGEVRGNWA